MILGHLIETLEKYPPDQKVVRGFGYPMSHRGDYSELAFKPVNDTTVGEMLAHAKSALGNTFEGYKGGVYKMSEWTNCHIADYGECGEEIGPLLLWYMLGDHDAQD